MKNKFIKRVITGLRIIGTRYMRLLTLLWKSVVETRYLMFPLLIIALICLYLWKRSINLAEFGLNAFTETLGIIVTVFIVDQLIINQEFRRSLPLRAATYEDVRLLVVRIVIFWHSAYKQSVPLATPRTVEELLTEATFEKIGRYLDLDSKPHVTPARTWWQYLPEQQTDFFSRGETILERYAGNLEPRIYSLVRTLTTTMMKPDLLNALRLAHEEMKFPSPHNLGSYFGTNKEVFSLILQLINWCKEESVLLESYGLSIMLLELDKLPYRDAISSPPCMINPERYQKQLHEVEEFRKQLAASKSSNDLPSTIIVD